MIALTGVDHNLVAKIGNLVPVQISQVNAITALGDTFQQRRLFGALVGSENRSLQPVGKSHYIARIRLQPGDTTIYIQGDQWEVKLPRDVSAREFLITLYRPPGGTSELHVFAVDELLAEDDPHIPAWLPDNLQLDPRAG